MLLANLFTIANRDPAGLQRALADALTVPAAAVDVADTEADQCLRRWNAPALCTYRALPLGDLALELEVQVEDGPGHT